LGNHSLLALAAPTKREEGMGKGREIKIKVTQREETLRGG